MHILEKHLNLKIQDKHDITGNKKALTISVIHFNRKEMSASAYSCETNPIQWHRRTKIV